MYDAIFFDLDGTLIDTERVAIETGKQAFSALDIVDPDALLHRLIGVDQPTAAEMIRTACPEIDLDRLKSEWGGRFEAAIAADIPLKAGAETVVHGLSRTHQLALVTSSGRDAAMDKLHRSGLLPAFKTIVVREDVIAPKPAPDPYLLAAARLGATVDRCLVFEDSEPGVEAAHRAGMVVIQIPDIHPATGKFARHVAADLLGACAWAGLKL